MKRYCTRSRNSVITVPPKECRALDIPSWYCICASSRIAGSLLHSTEKVHLLIRSMQHSALTLRNARAVEVLFKSLLFQVEFEHYGI